jgi:hypothetical protein
MKKFALTLMCLSAAAFGFSAAAETKQQQEPNRPANFYHQVRPDRIGWEIDHVNQMIAYVRWETGKYGASMDLRNNLDRVEHDLAHVNTQHRRYTASRTYLRDQLQQIQADVHKIEAQLHHGG